MEETGTVIGIGDRTAVVATEAKSICHGCSARGICHMSSRKGCMEIEVWNRLDAAVGDRVVIQVSGGSTLKAALLLYLVPLLGFLLGVFLGQRFIGHQAWAVIIGLIFLVFIYSGIRLLDRRFARDASLRPEIVRILNRQDQQSPKNETG